ncbi:MAG TPA: L-lactate permease [Pseudorhizobium sp.]|nr:L-lactate permease [Pseudorhizobium sp.]
MLIHTILAAAPLVIVLLTMSILGWSAVGAGAAGFASAIIIAFLAFGLGPPFVSPPLAALGVLAETVHSTATILWIILPALLLYEYQQRSGGLERIRLALSQLTNARRLQVLVIGWFFALFMEGAAGFGAPVAVAAPLLVGIGLSPARAVMVALIGHAAGVPFGAVGTPTLTQVELGGLPLPDLAGTIAAFNAVMGFGLVFAVSWLADDAPMTSKDVRRTAMAGVCFLFPYGVVAVTVGPELPTLLGALLGLLAFVLLLRAGHARSPIHWRALLPDLLPYLLLVLLVLATRLVPPLREELVGLAWSWDFLGHFSGSFAPLFHPGTLLLVSIALAALATSRQSALAPAFAAALGRLGSVALALLLMLALARVLVHSGMVDQLAEGAARSGGTWPFLAAVVGTLGTFVSGSGTASNILFTQFQISTAQVLQLPPVLMAAAQGAGAAIGNVIAPHNIIAGCATVGLAGGEGRILRWTAPICVSYLAAIGMLVAAIAS